MEGADDLALYEASVEPTRQKERILRVICISIGPKGNERDSEHRSLPVRVGETGVSLYAHSIWLTFHNECNSNPGQAKQEGIANVSETGRSLIWSQEGAQISKQNLVLLSLTDERTL